MPKKHKATIWTNTPNKQKIEREQTDKNNRFKKERESFGYKKKNYSTKEKELNDSSAEEETLLFFEYFNYLNNYSPGEIVI